MNVTRWLLLTLFLAGIPFSGTAQNCFIIAKANDIQPDGLCSPVQVVWTVSYVGVHDNGASVQIRFDWDDGSSDTEDAVEINAGNSEWEAVSTHTYVSNDLHCNYHPVATLIVDGVTCSSSSQEQIVTVWDTDDENGGRVNADPDVYPVCVGNGATMRFDDGTLFNCVPPQERDVPNTDTRWIQWVYGTNNTMSSSTPVSVNGYTGPWPMEGPVITLTGPVTGSNERSLPITVADDNLVGEEFEVELRYWNYCNPYPTDPPETDRSVIRIVDNPDATITPVDSLCEFAGSIIMVAATPGGTWSGNGILNASTGEFAPYVAGPGTQEISYTIRDGNGCEADDTTQIIVTDAPDGEILPIDPLCIYDPPFDMEAIPNTGTWSGTGITDTVTGLFDPATAGPGTHAVVFTTPPDMSGCVGIDSFLVGVADLPYAEFLTPDSTWCQKADNSSLAEILLTGGDTSRYDLVIEIQGAIDTLYNLPADTFTLYLNNQAGQNTYILQKVIEHHGSNSCETDLHDTLAMVVHPLPHMTILAETDDICSPVNVTFLANEGYFRYNWDFGDGDHLVTSGGMVNHVFTYTHSNTIIDIIGEDTIYGPPGTDTLYYTRLSIESEFGCRDSTIDSVRVYSTPVADFFAHPEMQYYPDSLVFITNLSSPGEWSYYWDFGDQSTSSEKDPLQHIYETWGIYDIELTAYNTFCSDNIIKKVQIIPPAPTASFEPDTMGCPPLKVTFRNNSTYADTYIWSFDDGEFSTDPAPTHTFWESREHHVRLVVFGLAGTDTTEQIITVHERPRALFDAYPTFARNLKQVFKFRNNSLNSSYYLWDFGDGTTSPEDHPEHIYPHAGTYSVTLYVWSEYDCPDTLMRKSLITLIAGEGNTRFPNAFVWNGTGPTGGHWNEGAIDNTVFHPYLINAVDLHMIIYTRWGEMIWETRDVYVGWDGYLKSGELAPPGVYVYKAWVTYVDGEEAVFTGDVTFLH